MISENGDCYRCEQHTKATVFCRNCEYTQQFCETCSKFRGKRIREKFTCLICIFLKNHNSEEETHLTEEGYRKSKRDVKSYVPQI